MATDYGIDLWGFEDLDANLTTITGPLAVAHAVARRYLTMPGTLWYAPHFGYGLQRHFNDDAPSEGQIEADLEIEALKDQRVSKAEVSVTRAGESLAINAQLICDKGPFTLVMTVTALKADLFIQPT